MPIYGRGSVGKTYGPPDPYPQMLEPARYTPPCVSHQRRTAACEAPECVHAPFAYSPPAREQIAAESAQAATPRMVTTRAAARTLLAAGPTRHEFMRRSGGAIFTSSFARVLGLNEPRDLHPAEPVGIVRDLDPAPLRILQAERMVDDLDQVAVGVLD